MALPVHNQRSYGEVLEPVISGPGSYFKEEEARYNDQGNEEKE